MKTLSLLFISIIFSSLLIGQNPQPDFTLNQEIYTYDTKEYIASDYVNMIPGFYAHPSSGYHVQAKIDPLMVIPPDEDLTGGPTNNNEGGVVGSLPGNLDVSASGAAVYNIPVEAPAGVNGMTPQIGLVYSSQSGNGLLGMGWGVSGLSDISRTGTTLYHDGFIDGVDLDDNDQLMLNGQRLIAINDNNTEYRTELESFSKIVVKESNQYGPVWFEVHAKDGRIYEYGRTTNSRLYTNDGLAILKWKINKLKDRSGNYISFTYSTTGYEENKIVRIDYGGNENTGQSPFYNIDFVYASGRSDPIKYWISGNRYEEPNLLTNIKIHYQNGQSAIKNYELTYNYSDFYTHLEKVTLFDGSGNKLNPTVFTWGEQMPEFTHSTTNIQSPGFVDFSFGDFDGDGRTDVVRAYYGYDDDGERENYNWTVSYAGETGTYFNEVLQGNLDQDNEIFKYFITGDFNGDGLCDLFKIIDNGSIHDGKYLFSNGSSFEQGQISFIGLLAPSYYFRVVDMNGNGVDEVLLIRNFTNNTPNQTFFASYEYVNNGVVCLFEDPDYHTPGYSFAHQAGDLFEITPGDFDGDGKTDLLVNTDHLESTIFRLNVDAKKIEELNDTRFGFPTRYHRVFTGDFNGDGITDILTHAWSNPNVAWELHYFDGEGSWIPGSCPIIKTIDPEAQDYDNFYLVSDFNGDYKSDILETYKIWENGIIIASSVNVHYSNGSNFITECNTGSEINPSLQKYFNKIYDFNGDGKSDIFDYNVPYDIKKIHFFSKDENRHQIHAFTNGLGYETTINYLPLTSFNIYSKGSGSTYPVVDIQPALYAVRDVKSSNGIGGFVRTDYRYYYARMHLQGKGFLGFGKIMVTQNPYTTKSIKRENIYSLNTDYYFSWLKKSSTYGFVNSVGETLLKETTNAVPQIKDFGNKRYFYYIPRSLTKFSHTGDLNSSYIKTTLSTQEYSDTDILYGNLTNQANYSDDNSLSLDAPAASFDYYSKTSYSYDVNPSSWLFRVTSIEEQKYDQSDPNLHKITTDYIYYPSSPLVETETVIPDNANSMKVVSTFLYDDYGNIEQVTTSAPNYTPAITDRTTFYKYDQAYQHRFLTEKKKVLYESGAPVEYISTSYFYADKGLPKLITGIDGLSTFYEYDGFGRLQKVTYPDGVIEENKLVWSLNHEDNPEYGLYYSWIKASGENPVIAFHDELGRTLLTVNKNINDQNVYNKSVYDIYGNLKNVSNSYYSTTDQLWTSYEYLASGLQKKVVSPTTEVEYTYNGRATTAKNNTLQITTSKEYNAIGQLISATDPGGTVTYEYFSSGQPHMITFEGNQIEILYDEAGFQQSLYDPDAGLIQYDYNPFGELISQTNANNHKYLMQYDNLGRLKKETLEGSQQDITIYKYVPKGANGFGQLLSVEKDNIRSTYSYDQLGRVSTKVKDIEGNSYKFSFDYDIFGRNKSLTWPSGFKINYLYKNSYLAAVEQADNGLLIWKLSDVNAEGQLKRFELGNGLVTNKEYDMYGFPTDIITGQNVQDLSYDFNTQTGNLNSRSFSLMPPFGSHTWSENFTYDEDKFKNRLKSWSIPGGAYNSTDYQNNGNIDTKTGLGTYKYNEDHIKPHAVIKVEDPDPAYLSMAKANRQEITYTAFDKAASIWQGNLSDPEQIKTLDITYGPMQERVKTVYKLGGQIKKSKIFVGQALEIEETSGHNIRQLHYIHAGDGLCAIYVTDEEAEDGQMFYIHKDYLDSYETISDESGTAIEKLNFDPWGRRRSPSNGSIAEEASSFLFDRGFTGHEHLDAFGLINMNGRMYDPLLGRFLSPDPIISNPAQSQHYNRYSYVWNNPLKFIDPSGYNPAPFMNENLNSAALPRQGFLGPTSGNHWSDPYRSAQGNFYLMSGLDYIPQFGAASYQAQYNAAMGMNSSMGNSTSDFDREVNDIIADIINRGLNAYLVSPYNYLVYGEGTLDDMSINEFGSVSFSNRTMGALAYQINGSYESTWDHYTNEQISSLHPAIRNDAANFINEAANQGVNLRIPKYPHPGGYRTFKEQDKIYSQGRTSPGKIISYASAGESYHNYGLAFDVYQISNGTVVTFDPSVVIPISERYGFQWGGNFGDPPHFQNSFGYSWDSLLNMYNTGKVVNGYPVIFIKL